MPDLLTVLSLSGYYREAQALFGASRARATDFDAFNDNPWPLLYKTLDATFPAAASS